MSPNINTARDKAWVNLTVGQMRSSHCYGHLKKQWGRYKLPLSKMGLKNGIGTWPNFGLKAWIVYGYHLCQGKGQYETEKLSKLLSKPNGVITVVWWLSRVGCEKKVVERSRVGPDSRNWFQETGQILDFLRVLLTQEFCLVPNFYYQTSTLHITKTLSSVILFR